MLRIASGRWSRGRTFVVPIFGKNFFGLANLVSLGSHRAIRTAPRLMPGIVNLYVWQPAANLGGECLELSQQRNVVVFGANPGAIWGGFSSFIRSLANEYATAHIQLYVEQPERGTKPTAPPDLLHRSLLQSLPDSFLFPQNGSLSLIIIAGGNRPQTPFAEFLPRTTTA